MSYKVTLAREAYTIHLMLFGLLTRVLLSPCSVFLVNIRYNSAVWIIWLDFAKNKVFKKKLGLYFLFIIRVAGSFIQPLHHVLRVAFAMLSTLLQTVSNHRSEMYRGLINEAKHLYKTYHFIREGDLYKTFQKNNASYIR